MSGPRKTVAIIGAGPVGLAAACHALGEPVGCPSKLLSCLQQAAAPVEIFKEGGEIPKLQQMLAWTRQGDARFFGQRDDIVDLEAAFEMHVHLGLWKRYEVRIHGGHMLEVGGRMVLHDAKMIV